VNLLPRCLLSTLLATSVLAAPCRAQDADQPAPPHADLFDSGKLLATGGVTQVEGTGGSGLVPWALITGYGTQDAIGANAHFTYIRLPDFELRSYGVAVGLFDRVEVSYARQAFDTGGTGTRLGLGHGFTFNQDIVGAKVRLFGNAVYDQDWFLPQVAIGAQYKSNDRGAVLHAIGARDADGVDFYVAATKLLLGESLLLNGTIRATRANQFGLLGFGGDKNNGYSAQFEGSAALLLTRQLAIGADYRTKPSNLSFAKEDNAVDAFVAYFFNKNLSATLAYVGLGDIALQKNENGVYLSLQAGF
jgi:hypothetical protein